MTVHILYPFVEGPWGGANQFLKAIKNHFINIGVYEEDILCADIILFNSSPSALSCLLTQIYRYKKKFKNKLFINRIDGPVFYIRDRNIFIDKAFYLFNDKACDGTIFQSNWSKEKNYLLGMLENKFETTILNAPNPIFFNNVDKLPFEKRKKVRLIATSWSNNWKKGFEVYKWLDDNLDFDKYEMTFIGNSPIKFKNILSKKPVDSETLAKELKQHDIFITASQKDPCSNSLIEALHCGLPAIGLNDGGHPEIILSSGKVFEKKEDIPSAIDDIVENYKKYQNSIALPSINEVGKLYYEFLQTMFNIHKSTNYRSKKLDYIGFIRIKFYIYLWEFEEKIFSFKNRLKRIK